MNNTDINITEVCPRDGFQSINEFIPTEEKINLINKIIDCGFKQIEVSSFVHPNAIPQLKDADEVLKHIKRCDQVKLRALVPNVRGLERAISAGVDKVKLMLSASDSHSISNANCTTIEALQKFETLVELADFNKMKVSGSISVAFGCPFEGDIPLKRHIMICEYYQSLGINEISLADTTGMANPVKTRQIVRELKHRFPDITFSLHLHNTRGMAFANAYAGWLEGIVDFDSSIAGIGGCPYAPGASGNISSEDLIHGFEEMGLNTGISLDKVIGVARDLQGKFTEYSDSFLLKAGKCSDLKAAPIKQQKIVK